jgi:mono/diheme cytochrome c family protein
MPSMPAIDLPADDIRAIAEYIHSILATARGQGNPPPGPPVTLIVLVGDAVAGRAYFESKCVACHSAPAISAESVRAFQSSNFRMLVAGGAGGRGGGTNALTATVTSRDEKVEGRVIRS